MLSGSPSKITTLLRSVPFLSDIPMQSRPDETVLQLLPASSAEDSDGTLSFLLHGGVAPMVNVPSLSQALDPIDSCYRIIKPGHP
ncbi:hypothetical protein VTL71DRAFT_5798, partial [Oculimacula yallundae]